MKTLGSTILTAARQHAWIALLIFTICLCLFPIGYRITRIFLLASAAILFMWGIFLLRRHKLAVFTILVIGLIVLAWLYSSGKPGDPNILKQSYIQSLKQYKG